MGDCQTMLKHDTEKLWNKDGVRKEKNDKICNFAVAYLDDIFIKSVLRNAMNLSKEEHVGHVITIMQN